MKLKPNELRINNWYKSAKFQVPVQCMIEDFYELCVLCDDADLDEEIISRMFEPLPLTEEWLVKSNCSKINVPNMYAIGRGDVCISIRFLEEGGNKICIITDDEELYLKNHVKYLHEFQNLCLDLTKEEVIFKKIS